MCGYCAGTTLGIPPNVCSNHLTTLTADMLTSELSLFHIFRYSCVYLIAILIFLFQVYGYTPLHMACLYDQTRVVAEILKKLKNEPNAVNTKDNVSTIIIVCMQNVHV